MLERLSARDSVFTDTPSNIQVFLASNNQIGSVQALGNRPKKGWSPPRGPLQQLNTLDRSPPLWVCLPTYEEPQACQQP
ncbi:unnamed protein product, partial [Ectocarpus sp. 12 AP-2014]